LAFKSLHWLKAQQGFGPLPFVSQHFREVVVVGVSDARCRHSDTGGFEQQGVCIGMSVCVRGCFCSLSPFFGGGAVLEDT